MWSIFVLGSIGFWILIVALVIAVLYSLETESKTLGATISLVVAGLLFYWCGGKPVLTDLFESIKEHPGNLILLLLGYLLVGTVWSFVKWYQFLLRFKQRIITDERNAYKPPTDEEILAVVKAKRPKAFYHKSDILAWMIYWPLSMIWTLIDDPIKRLFTAIYNKLSGQYERLSERMFSKL